MGCCGGGQKQKKPVNQEQQTIVQQVNNEVQPVQSTLFLDNINSQRAAKTIRENYHKQRFWHG